MTSAKRSRGGTAAPGTPGDERPTGAAPDVTDVTDAPNATEVADDAADSADFVTFVVEGETYAFPMERVEEIIRMPQVVRVPLGPPSLVGLANLRGRILPVVSLRACCGLPPVEADEATRVVVVDGGSTLGFVVDRVASVTSVPASRVEPGDVGGGAVDSDLLAAVVRPEDDGGELAKVLDVPALVAGQFALLAGAGDAADPASGLLAGVAGEAGDGAAAEDDDTLELVSFAVDGQEYALPIDRVQEIVQAPERVTTVPHTADRLLGVMDLRGRLLPVVGLRQVFGLDPAPLEPHNRIVVVHLPGGDPAGEGTASGGVVGVVMDTVREVLRVPRALVADLPEFMARSAGAREVDAVCRLEDGRRLVSVLAVERMFADADLRTAVRDAAGDDEPPGGGRGTEDDVADDRGADAEGDDELLVVFRLAGEEYCVDVDAVQEIIRVPESLIRVPRTPEFVEGLVNLRGAVLPVVDLRTRLGLPRGERDERQRIMVLVVGGVRTGFVVDSVAEVLRVGRADLEPAPELSAEQARVVRHVANLADRMLLMLEPDELLAFEQLALLVPQQRQGEGAGLPADGPDATDDPAELAAALR